MRGQKFDPPDLIRFAGRRAATHHGACKLVLTEEWLADRLRSWYSARKEDTAENEISRCMWYYIK